MKKSFVAVAAALVLSLAALNASAQTSAAKPAKGEAAFFPLEEVRPGQKGVGRTVFRGSETEEFGVEILGVLQGFPAPRQSAIIAKLTGANVEKTRVFGGMSGSPVFIDGKLVGAVAFAFPFAQEPIAGITPIQQMVDIFARGQGTRRTDAVTRTYSFAQLASTDWQPAWPKPMITGAPFLAPVTAGSPLHALLGQQLLPIATPVIFTGVSPEALARFAPQLQASGLLPVAGVGSGSPITPLGKVTEKTLLPGSSVSAQLVRGDFSLAAAGTVTWRDGDKVYAFGHPFLGLGVADMPMAESSVVTVIANLNNSFKLSSPGQMVGTVSQDRATGIYGKLGQAPKMIPVTVNVQTSRDRAEKYTFEVANDQFLTPLLLNITVYSTLTSTERSLGEATVSISGRIDVAGQQPIRLERRFSSMIAGVQAAGSVAAPVAALLSSGFDDVTIKGITLDITSEDARKAGTLDRIALDRTEVGRGETVEVQAFVRTDSGRQFVQRIPVTIPTDIPLGQLVLFVGDGGALQQASAAQNFVPKDLTQLVGAINKIKKNDRLYVRLLRPSAGAVVGTDEMPSLPPSVVATLNSERSSGGYTPTALSPVAEQELPPAEFVIEGQQLITVSVIR
ncbi:MAG TPA: SpoIVB peptidase S55 domain-containing protein [Pyrinomonadaceae bacterium]|nr:SpoIVB peptidase S55 domain-containing protein [Pyrinomonadaceae bacterium]